MKPYNFRGRKPEEVGRLQTIHVLTGLYAFRGIYPCDVEDRQMANADQGNKRCHSKRSGRGGSKRTPIFRRYIEMDRTCPAVSPSEDSDTIGTFFDPATQEVVEAYSL